LKLIWDCHQSLAKLAEHNRVQLIWVPGHRGIEGNDTAHQLARLESECLFIPPEPACGISAGTVKKAVRDWTNRGICSGRWAYINNNNNNLCLVHLWFSFMSPAYYICQGTSRISVG
jgi:hypothetical protein